MPSSPIGARSRPLSLGLLCGATILLVLAWTMSNEPWSGPDEGSHFLRALEISQGKLLGPKIPYPWNLTPLARSFVDHDTRAVYVPAAMSPSIESCADRKPDLRGCIEATPTGDYYPLPYLLPAAAIAVAHSAVTALWASRVLEGLLCALCFIAALALLWEGTVVSVLGPLLALTPMAMFVASILNPSGLEIAANLACAAAALRMARGRIDLFGAVALATGGAITILSFQAGPGNVVLDVLFALALTPRRHLLEQARIHRRRLGWVAAILLLALVLWLLYNHVSGVDHTPFGMAPFWKSLDAGLAQLEPALRDAVGNFGALTIHPPMAARILWWTLTALVIAGGLVCGDTRRRLVLLLVVLVCAAYPVLSFAWIYRHSGFGLQGRQVLPALMLIPLYAGEVVFWRARSTGRSMELEVLAATVLAVWAVLEGYMWWFNARAAAHAPGTVRFWAYARWAPPGGWIPWIVLAALAIGGFLATAGGGLLSPFLPIRLRGAKSG